MKPVEQLFVGNEIRKVAEEFATLRMTVFREYPYLYEGTFSYELDYIQTYASSPNALLLALFEGKQMVGATTCIPLEEETEAVKTPFLEKGFHPSNYLYLGESMLLSSYRGKGFGKRFFEVREAFAKEKEKTISCFCSVNRPEKHPLRPEHYVNHHSFWKKQGYAEQKDLYCEMSWKDLDENEESNKNLTFWVKQL